MRNDQIRPKKTVIRWTGEEWDKLAELVHPMRRNSPDAIATLANRAQKQFPKHRQRPGTLTTATLQPLVERIQRMDRELLIKAGKCDELAAKLTFHEDAPSTREEMLANLSDKEICEHFAPRLLQILAPADVVAGFNVETLLGAMETADLAAVLARRLVIDFTTRPLHVTVQMPEQRVVPSSRRIKTTNGNGRANGNGNSNSKKKKIVIIGTKGDQPRHLQARVGALVDLICIEAEKLHSDAVPRGADHVILWSKFISHSHRQRVFASVEPRKVSEHFDGLTELGDFIESLCGLVPAR